MINFDINIVSKGGDSVSIELRPLAGSLSIPHMMQCMSEYGVAVEWYWQEKSKDSERNVPYSHFVHYKYHTITLNANLGLRGHRPANNRLWQMSWKANRLVIPIGFQP
jgi:hypothetical protein